MFVDRVVAVNKLVNLAKISISPCVILKVDFEKVYDSFIWSFLNYMLIKFGFSEEWQSWMKVCVFAGNLAVLVNVCLIWETNIQMGLKQGDPLALILFLLVVGDGLSSLVRRDEELGLYSRFRLEILGWYCLISSMLMILLWWQRVCGVTRSLEGFASTSLRIVLLGLIWTLSFFFQPRTFFTIVEMEVTCRGLRAWRDILIVRYKLLLFPRLM